MDCRSKAMTRRRASLRLFGRRGSSNYVEYSSMLCSECFAFCWSDRRLCFWFKPRQHAFILWISIRYSTGRDIQLTSLGYTRNIGDFWISVRHFWNILRTYECPVLHGKPKKLAWGNCFTNFLHPSVHVKTDSCRSLSPATAKLLKVDFAGQILPHYKNSDWFYTQMNVLNDQR